MTSAPPQPVALGLFCKTPQAGESKTRLSPPLTPRQCADLSAAFIRDIADTMQEAARETPASPCAIYTPRGSEGALRVLLPADFTLVAQGGGDLGARLIAAMRTLFAKRHAGVIFLNADAPTLPVSILRGAIRIVSDGGHVIAPALDGGYTLIGLSACLAALFEDIAWSTPAVFAQTRERAARLGVTLQVLPLWYDVDDAPALALLRQELAGERLPFAAAGLAAAPAAATRRCLDAFAQHERRE